MPIVLMFLARVRYNIEFRYLDPRVFSTAGFWLQQLPQGVPPASVDMLPANMTGSVLVEYADYTQRKDNNAPRLIWCRKRDKPPYQGTLTIPGGRAEGIDVPGLRETNEEMGLTLDRLRVARLLGVLDQVVVSKDGNLQRTINHLWFLTLESELGIRLGKIRNGDRLGNWKPYSVAQLVEEVKSGLLSPTLTAALIIRGYLNYHDMPEYRVHPDSYFTQMNREVDGKPDTRLFYPK